MRIHILLDDQLVADIDRLAGKRRRSDFIARVLRLAVANEDRWDDVESALGTLEGSEHEWDADVTRWVREQRSDRNRAG